MQSNPSIVGDELVMLSILDACQTFNEEIGDISRSSCSQLVYCLDALILIEMLSRLGKLEIEIPVASNDLTNQKNHTVSLVNQIEKHVVEFLEEYGSEDAQDRLARDRDNLKVEFSTCSHDRAQQLISELREIIKGSKSVGDEHKFRLLARLEKLQLELHKSTSDLDRFWGFIGVAGQTLGKFGEDTKPLVDRIRELEN